MHDCYPGIYKGVVMDNNDPNRMVRIRAQVPQVFGTTLSAWALPCVANIDTFPDTPQVGDPIWIMFEGGNPSWPVWMGRWFLPSQETV